MELIPEHWKTFNDMKRSKKGAVRLKMGHMITSKLMMDLGLAKHTKSLGFKQKCTSVHPNLLHDLLLSNLIIGNIVKPITISVQAILAKVVTLFVRILL